MTWTNFELADEVIKLFCKNSSVNLGIGMPTLIAERIPADLNIMIHSENGVLGVSGRPNKATFSPTLINAGKETISIRDGASFFDSSLSFGMIRGGHIDYCVLGGMEVDANKNLANWMVPGKKITGMGGAMDLVNGSKQVIVMMNHFAKDGSSKLVKNCSLPLTGFEVVDLVVTELGVFKPENKKFKIIKMAPNIKESDLKISIEILES
jgi:3-oxoacid CoA-transferase subunit B